MPVPCSVSGAVTAWSSTRLASVVCCGHAGAGPRSICVGAGGRLPQALSVAASARPPSNSARRRLPASRKFDAVVHFFAPASNPVSPGPGAPGVGPEDQALRLIADAPRRALQGARRRRQIVQHPR